MSKMLFRRRKKTAQLKQTSLTEVFELSPGEMSEVDLRESQKDRKRCEFKMLILLIKAYVIKGIGGVEIRECRPVIGRSPVQLLVPTSK